MRKVILTMQMTLDGFSTGPNDEWILFDLSVRKKCGKTSMKKCGKILILRTLLFSDEELIKYGRNIVAAANNPQSSESDKKFSRYADETRKFVVRSTDSVKNGKTPL